MGQDNHAGASFEYALVLLDLAGASVALFNESFLTLCQSQQPFSRLLIFNAGWMGGQRRMVVGVALRRRRRSVCVRT